MVKARKGTMDTRVEYTTLEARIITLSLLKWYPTSRKNVYILLPCCTALLKIVIVGIVYQEGETVQHQSSHDLLLQLYIRKELIRNAVDTGESSL